MMPTQHLQELLEQYPHWLPLTAAAPLLGVSARQLARLITDGREPFASLGANIGTRQNYVRVYTNRLVKYLYGESIVPNRNSERGDL